MKLALVHSTGNSDYYKLDWIQDVCHTLDFPVPVRTCVEDGSVQCDGCSGHYRYGTFESTAGAQPRSGSRFPPAILTRIRHQATLIISGHDGVDFSQYTRQLTKRTSTAENGENAGARLEEPVASGLYRSRRRGIPVCASSSVHVSANQASFHSAARRGTSSRGWIRLDILNRSALFRYPFEYLTELQKHAAELASQPGKWMPWAYRETLCVSCS